jgi:hypothetical protein
LEIVYQLVLYYIQIIKNDNLNTFIPSFEQHEGEIINNEIKKSTTKTTNINETIEKLKSITEGN